MSEIPGWLSDITIGEIFVFLGGLGALVAVWKKLSPYVRAFQNFLFDWNGEAGRPGVDGRKGVMETLHDHGTAIAEIQQQLAGVTAQVTPNHGSNLKLSEEVQHLRAEVRVNQGALNAHLENVPVLVSEILDKANQNAADMILVAKVGPTQPPLFGDKDF